METAKRDSIIAKTSGIGIIVNILIAGVKVVIGALTSSIAIVSEGVNNATDALTSVITLVGSKLAGRHPDEKHPFGYGRIEYLTSLVIAILILVTGFELLSSSVKLIIHPEELNISYLSLVIVAVSAVVKFALGTYTIRKGREVNSGALVALGVDSRNDCIISAVTIAAALVFLVFHFSLDAYAGIITSVFILKAGFEVLKDTVSELLGKAGEAELAASIYREIRATDGIINAADMMLHNYGPDAYSGSVNVEIDHEKTVGEIYAILHALQLKIMHEKKVTMVFGVYAVDADHEGMKELRAYIANFVRGTEHVKSYHALYVQPDDNRIFVDLVVEYALRDWDSLRKNFLAYMAESYPGQPVELVIETDYV